MYSNKLYAIITSVILILAGCQTLKNPEHHSSQETDPPELAVAMAFLDAGRPDKAMYELRPLLEQQPRNPKAHNLMGLSQLALRNPKKAVWHLESAWKIQPISPHALNLSSAYIENGQLDEAQKIIATALALKETPSYRNKERFYHNLGIVAEKRGLPNVAAKSYTRALEENPTFYLSRVKLAEHFDARRQTSNAKAQWDLARISCPTCFEPIQHLTEYYWKSGDTRTAKGILNDFRKVEGIRQTDLELANQLDLKLQGQQSSNKNAFLSAPRNLKDR